MSPPSALCRFYYLINLFAPQLRRNISSIHSNDQDSDSLYHTTNSRAKKNPAAHKRIVSTTAASTYLDSTDRHLQDREDIERRDHAVIVDISERIPAYVM